MADVFVWCNIFCSALGLEFQYRTESMKNHNMVLIIEVKYPLNDLTSQGEDKNDCAVCTIVHELIVCCKQPAVKNACKILKNTIQQILLR